MVESLPANAGDMGSSPGLGRSHMPRSNWAREPQLLSLRVWSLCSATREAAIVRGLRTAMKSGPHLPQLEKALAQKQRPNTAKKKKSCTTMFIAALFTITRTWKQPKCPSTDEWIKKMWYIYTMEYYSAIKRNKTELFVVRWMDLESVIQSEVSQKEKNKYHMLTHIYGILKKKKRF